MSISPSASTPPKVYTWRDWLGALGGLMGQLALKYATGRYNIVLTFLLGILFIRGTGVILYRLVLPRDLDWTEHIVWVAWASVVAAIAGVSLSALYAWSLTASLRRGWCEGTNRWLLGVFYAFVVWLAAVPMSAWVESEMLEYWWDMLHQRTQTMDIWADPAMGRIVAQGDMDFGSAMELERVMRENRHYTLLELNSPGGYVVEGMRMARLVRERKLDVVVKEECASACTLVFLMGQERYLAPKAKVGFHRSGSRREPDIDYGWRATDYRIADHYRSRGVPDAFVQRALKEPMFRIWWAPHAELYDAGFATKDWAERKFGY